MLVTKLVAIVALSASTGLTSFLPSPPGNAYAVRAAGAFTEGSVTTDVSEDHVVKRGVPVNQIGDGQVQVHPTPVYTVSAAVPASTTFSTEVALITVLPDGQPEAPLSRRAVWSGDKLNKKELKALFKTIDICLTKGLKTVDELTNCVDPPDALAKRDDDPEDMDDPDDAIDVLNMCMGKDLSNASAQKCIMGDFHLHRRGTSQIINGVPDAEVKRAIIVHAADLLTLEPTAPRAVWPRHHLVARALALGLVDVLVPV